MSRLGTDLPFDLSVALAQARALASLHQRNVHGAFAGGYRSVFKGAGIEFDEVREYVEGDDPRSVDWQISAKMGRPFVKRYVEEREQTVGFLVDGSPTVDCGFGPWSVRETCARLVAVLALTAAQNDDKTTLVRYGLGALDPVEGARGLDHALRLTRHVLTREPPSATDSASPRLRQALDHAIAHWRPRSLVLLCSDFVHEIDRDTEDALLRCKRFFDLRVLFVVPPELQETSLRDDAERPALRGLQDLSDPLTGATRSIDWSSPPVVAGYRRLVSEWNERRLQTFRRLGLPAVRVPIPAGHGSAHGNQHYDDLILSSLRRLYESGSALGGRP